jgi:hypothetical protein
MIRPMKHLKCMQTSWNNNQYIYLSIKNNPSDFS